MCKDDTGYNFEIIRLAWPRYEKNGLLKYALYFLSAFYKTVFVETPKCTKLHNGVNT